MTEYGLPFDGVSLGDAVNAPYSAAEWAAQWALQHGVGSAFPNYGILKGTGSGSYEALDVTATNPVSTDIEIQIGAALVNGWLYRSTAVETKAIGANASGNPRIDTVIIRIDFVAQTIRLVVKQGTPAASPARPTLQQDATYWEIPLADIAVANGFSTISQANISNRNRSVQDAGYGWQAFAYPPHYIPNSAYNSAVRSAGLNQGIAIPIQLTGNMLLNSVTVRYIGASINYNLSWGLYVQDVNDGNTAENTLRRIATGGNSGTTGAGPVNITLPASPIPVPIPPGAYWLVIKSSGAIGAFSFGGISPPSGFDSALKFEMENAVSVSIDQTLNLVTNWTTVTSVTAVRLNGRVFGQTSAF